MAPNVLQFIQFVHIFSFLFFIWPEAARSKLFVLLVWICGAVLLKCTNGKWICNLSDKSDQQFFFFLFDSSVKVAAFVNKEDDMWLIFFAMSFFIRTSKSYVALGIDNFHICEHFHFHRSMALQLLHQQTHSFQIKITLNLEQI